MDDGPYKKCGAIGNTLGKSFFFFLFCFIKFINMNDFYFVIMKTVFENYMHKRKK
jgi:hypothetical protein